MLTGAVEPDAWSRFSAMKNVRRSSLIAIRLVVQMSPLVLHVTGARPNFPKAAPVHRALAARGVTQLLVHTGQHYDDKMSDIFFRELELPTPDVNLGVGSGTHAHQTAAVMIGLEELFTRERPGLVVVYGDVNSTLAAALVAAKLQIPTLMMDASDEDLFDIMQNCAKAHEILRSKSSAAVDYKIIDGIDHYGIYFDGFDEGSERALAWFLEHL